tara:strand:- start:109 stop:756 length:648 start_codon:yes stop_codon:yes gene_type:complete
MTRLTDFFGGNGTTKKVQVLTSGTSWTAPADLLDGLVSVTMIAAGQARYLTGAIGGQGGSVITEALVPVVATTAYTFAIGTQTVQLTTPATSSSANAGGNTVFNYQGGTLTAYGGGASRDTDVFDTVGANRATSLNAQPGAGKYGCYAPWVNPAGASTNGHPTSMGGGGIIIGGIPYGFGANSVAYTGTGTAPADNTTNYGKQGVIYLQWTEKVT